ncbi:MAG: hypothetical protein GAK45_01973 [Pseudomonas citronellolis]|nr:MAG: hypothetical protein GAK45_01973 [Pseudomonas citronellolis]
MVDGGRQVALFVEEARRFARAGQARGAEFDQPLLEALTRLEAVTHLVRDSALKDPAAVGAASVDYLHLFGYTAYAYMWARMARAALAGGNGSFYQGKLATARFYVGKLLPRSLSLEASIVAGSQSLYGLHDDQF